MGRGQAGVLFLRPCAPIAAHMLQLASLNRLLQFPYHDAEQDFFDWCGHATGIICGSPRLCRRTPSTASQGGSPRRKTRCETSSDLHRTVCSRRAAMSTTIDGDGAGSAPYSYATIPTAMHTDAALVRLECIAAGTLLPYVQVLQVHADDAAPRIQRPQRLRRMAARGCWGSKQRRISVQHVCRSSRYY